MGTSLSTLPPDLHNLLTQLHPLLAATEQTESQQLQALQTFVAAATEIRHHERRVQQATACADALADLVAAEAAVKRDVSWRRYGKIDFSSSSSGTMTEFLQKEDVVEEQESEANHGTLSGKIVARVSHDHWRVEFVLLLGTKRITIAYLPCARLGTRKGVVDSFSLSRLLTSLHFSHLFYCILL